MNDKYDHMILYFLHIIWSGNVSWSACIDISICQLAMRKVNNIDHLLYTTLGKPCMLISCIIRSILAKNRLYKVTVDSIYLSSTANHNCRPTYYYYTPTCQHWNGQWCRLWTILAKPRQQSVVNVHKGTHQERHYFTWVTPNLLVCRPHTHADITSILRGHFFGIEPRKHAPWWLRVCDLINGGSIKQYISLI